MPAYDWECQTCGERREVISPIAQRNEPQQCPCGAAMMRVICAPHAVPDLPEYMAVAGDMAGKPISGRRAHREFLKRNRLVEVGNEPIRSTREFRSVTNRRETVEALKAAIAQHTVPDFKRGGLRER